jgi:hypothetical protein
MPKKFDIVIAEDGTVSGTSEDENLGSQLLSGVATPFGITAESNEVISKRTAAIGSITHFVVGLGIGEALGHNRARAGKMAFVPFLRS